MHLDNLETGGEWTLEGQPAVKINSAYAWVICPEAASLSSANLVVETGSGYYSNKSWSVTTNYSSFVSTGGTFDYDHATPQYGITPAEVVVGPKKIYFSISTPRYECNAPRILINYTGFSVKTLAAVKTFKAIMDSALSDLSDVRNNNVGNYPTAYVLTGIKNKIQNAINSLP